MEKKSLLFKRGTEVYVPANLICRYHGDCKTLVGKIDSYEKHRVRVIIQGLNGAFPVPRDKVWPVYESDLARALQRIDNLEKQRARVKKQQKKKPKPVNCIVGRYREYVPPKISVPSSVSSAVAHPYSGGMVRPR